MLVRRTERMKHALQQRRAIEQDMKMLESASLRDGKLKAIEEILLVK